MGAETLNRVNECTARNLFRYGLGHLETEGELGAVKNVYQAYASSGYSFKTLVIELVASDVFRYADVVAWTSGCGGVVEKKSATWADVSVGSTFELRTVTQLQRVEVGEVVSSTRQTLLSKTDEAADISFETDSPLGKPLDVRLGM
jgi:hypothetical protein